MIRCKYCLPFAFAFLIYFLFPQLLSSPVWLLHRQTDALESEGGNGKHEQLLQWHVMPLAGR